MMENNIRFRQIGRLDNLPEPVLDEVRPHAGGDEEQRRPDARARAELRQPGGDHRRASARSPRR